MKFLKNFNKNNDELASYPTDDLFGDFFLLCLNEIIFTKFQNSNLSNLPLDTNLSAIIRINNYYNFIKLIKNFL